MDAVINQLARITGATAQEITAWKAAGKTLFHLFYYFLFCHNLFVVVTSYMSYSHKSVL